MIILSLSNPFVCLYLVYKNSNIYKFIIKQIKVKKQRKKKIIIYMVQVTRHQRFPSLSRKGLSFIDFQVSCACCIVNILPSSVDFQYLNLVLFLGDNMFSSMKAKHFREIGSIMESKTVVMHLLKCVYTYFLLYLLDFHR